MGSTGGVKVSSTVNPMVRAAHSLLDVRERRIAKRFLLEGVKHVHDAIANGSLIHRLFVHHERLEYTEAGRLLWLMIEQQPDLYVVDVNERAISAISDVETNQGIIAEVAIPAPPTNLTQMPFLLVLDHISDPGNLGTILRSAVASGIVDGVVLIGGTDPYGPKVVRASAAALLLLPILAAPADEVMIALENRHLVAATSGSSTPYHQFTWPVQCGLIIGSEGSGVSSAMRAKAPESVSIPIADRIESLNAGVAASILLFDIARRRAIAR